MSKKKNNEQKKKSDVLLASQQIAWTPHAWDEYLYWQKHDAATVNKINDLLAACLKDPFRGIGKPEALKANLTGFWARRINQKDRLVYLPQNSNIYIVQCRFHYTDR